MKEQNQTNENLEQETQAQQDYNPVSKEEPEKDSIVIKILIWLVLAAINGYLLWSLIIFFKSFGEDGLGAVAALFIIPFMFLIFIPVDIYIIKEYRKGTILKPKFFKFFGKKNIQIISIFFLVMLVLAIISNWDKIILELGI